MSSIPAQVVLVLILLFLAFLAGQRRWLSVPAFLLAGVMAIVGGSLLVGRPKPVTWEVMYRDVNEARVLWATGRPGDGIYAVLSWEKQSEPRLYRLPWSEEMAEGLAKAQRDSRATGMPVTLRNPFKGGQGTGSGDERGGKGSGKGKGGKGSGKPGEEGTGVPGSGTGGGRDGREAEPRFWSPPVPSLPPKDR